MARELQAAVDRGADEARAWLVSDRGRRYRAYVAAALALTAPVIMRHPIFRTPVGRVVQLAGGAALLAKAADAIRDWEPAVSPSVDRRPRS